MSNKELPPIGDQITHILNQTGWFTAIREGYDVVEDAERLLEAVQRQKAIEEMNA